MYKVIYEYGYIANFIDRATAEQVARRDSKWVSNCEVHGPKGDVVRFVEGERVDPMKLGQLAFAL